VGFGSTIAARLVRDHPEVFCAYVAAGQIADRRSVRETTAYVHAMAQAKGDAAALAALDLAGPDPFADTPYDPKKIDAWTRGSAPFRPRAKAFPRPRPLGSASAARHSEAMATRYVIRRDATGFTVADSFTGEALVLAMDPQTGLSEKDAQHLAELLNRRSDQGDRALHQ
jgi:hypothetical protein